MDKKELFEITESPLTQLEVFIDHLHMPSVTLIPEFKVGTRSLIQTTARNTGKGNWLS